LVAEAGAELVAPPTTKSVSLGSSTSDWNPTPVASAATAVQVFPAGLKYSLALRSVPETLSHPPATRMSSPRRVAV
jgi:hypothetical protein